MNELASLLDRCNEETTGFKMSEILLRRSRVPLSFEGSVLHITTRNLAELERDSGEGFYKKIIKPLSEETVSTAISNMGWPEHLILGNYAQIVFGNPILIEETSIDHSLQAFSSARNLREKYGLISDGLIRDGLPKPKIDFLINSGRLIYSEFGLSAVRRFGYIGGVLRESIKTAEEIEGSNLEIYLGQKARELLGERATTSPVSGLSVPLHRVTS